MKIAVIDGKGGGLGKSLIQKLKKHYGNEVCVIALGLGKASYNNMNNANPDIANFGEEAIAYWSSKVDIIMGPIGIIVPNAMEEEVTPLIAKCIGESCAKKIMLPINKCRVFIPGTLKYKMSYMIDEAVKMNLNSRLRLCRSFYFAYEQREFKFKCISFVLSISFVF